MTGEGSGARGTGRMGGHGIRLFTHPFSPAQVSAVCQHVRRVPPRGEGALCLVPGLQPRRPSAAHHEVAGDQLTLPGGLRPPLRVHLSPTAARGQQDCGGWGAGNGAGRLLLQQCSLQPSHPSLCIYFWRQPFCTELNPKLSAASCCFTPCGGHLPRAQLWPL